MGSSLWRRRKLWLKDIHISSVKCTLMVRHHSLTQEMFSTDIKPFFSPFSGGRCRRSTLSTRGVTCEQLKKGGQNVWTSALGTKNYTCWLKKWKKCTYHNLNECRLHMPLSKESITNQISHLKCLRGIITICRLKVFFFLNDRHILYWSSLSWSWNFGVGMCQVVRHVRWHK